MPVAKPKEEEKAKKVETIRLRHSRAVKPSQTWSNQRVLEIMIKIKITIRSSYPKIGPVSAQSNQSNPVKPGQTRKEV